MNLGIKLVSNVDTWKIVIAVSYYTLQIGLQKIICLKLKTKYIALFLSN